MQVEKPHSFKCGTFGASSLVSTQPLLLTRILGKNRETKVFPTWRIYVTSYFQTVEVFPTGFDAHHRSHAFYCLIDMPLIALPQNPCPKMTAKWYRLEQTLTQTVTTTFQSQTLFCKIFACT